MISPPPFPLFTEPWRITVRRTGLLALAIGSGAGLWRRQFVVVPVATLLALWFTLGGHFVELLYRNQLRHRIGRLRLAQAVARLATWFVGGSALYGGALATWVIVTGHPTFVGFVRSWWWGGVLFVGLELVAHGLLRARRQPSFYDGRG